VLVVYKTAFEAEDRSAVVVALVPILVVVGAPILLLKALDHEIEDPDLGRRRLGPLTVVEAQSMDRDHVGARRRLQVDIEASVQVGSVHSIHAPSSRAVGLENRPVLAGG
jgi:hypothetical protein